MSEEIQNQMYVQQIEWETFISVMERITNVNRLYMFNMPNKAEKYISDVSGMIQTLDDYLSGDEEWRVTNEKNVNFRYNKDAEMIEVGNWLFGKPLLILCIPKLNSFFIVPDKDALYKGSPNPTQILQLSNCISIAPMLLNMQEIPNPEKENSFNISMSFELLKS